MRRPAQGGLRAVLDIVIDEAGTVASVVVRQSIAPWYDELLTSEAKRWSYKPATKNGTPVRYRKLVQVVVEG
jgi:TonB family protein